MAHYAVIGRVLGDDEDSCYTYDDCDRDEAIALFTADVMLPGDKEDEVFVNNVLVSDSPISNI